MGLFINCIAERWKYTAPNESTFRPQRIQAPNGLLKLYDQGADLSLEKAMQVLSLKKTSRLELQEFKSATIDAIGSKR